MKILHRYLLFQFLRNLGVFLFVSTLLFLIVEFFDRIDNIANENPPFWTIVHYFLFKIPLLVHVMLPVAVLVTTLFTIGLLSKHSEMTAMRSSGATLFWISRPILCAGLVISLLAIVFNETVIPYSARRVHEIYNIDIRKKHETGTYSKENVWWRSGRDFYSISAFDSRSNTMLDFSRLELNTDFKVTDRTNAHKVRWIDENLGWSMHQVVDFDLAPDNSVKSTSVKRLTLPITEKPEYFYDVRLDAELMSFRALKKYMRKLANDGISTKNYISDLHAKLAFPFINFIVILVALPFALKPGRSGNLGASFIAGITIGFLYYVVHSFSFSLGRAELMNAILAAWMANILMGFVGVVLNWGAEAP